MAKIEESFKLFKKKSIKIAKELGYKEDVIEDIKNSNNRYDITKILADARRR